MSSQGQASPALASPPSPPTLLSCPHLLPPAVFSRLQALPPPGSRSSFLCISSPLCFSCPLCLTLCLYHPSPPPPQPQPQTPTPTGALCVLELRGWQPESAPPHPPTHAQLGRSSHNSVPSHQPRVHSHSLAIHSLCCPPGSVTCPKCSSRGGLKPPNTSLTPPKRLSASSRADGLMGVWERRMRTRD